jgi:putative transcriptional regulator
MDRTRFLNEVESLFQKAEYSLSQRCCVRPSCFDFAARKEDQLVLAKAYPNIEKVQRNDSNELRTLARVFSGTPLFVCERTRDKPLEDDTKYSRYKVGAVTLGTLEDTLLSERCPIVEAGPGGYYVRLNGRAVRKRRLQKQLSVGKMAQILGVSRRTIYGYEKGMAKACVSTAYRLAWVLGMPVATPIDIFHSPTVVESFIATARRIIGASRFLQFVTGKLLQFDFTVFYIRRAPFDFVASHPDSKISILGAVARGNEQNLEARTKEILAIGRVVDAQPMFVADNDGVSPDSVPLLHKDELEQIESSDDLMARL